MSETLEAKGVSRIFPTPKGPFLALEKTDLVVEKGEAVAIVGRSGCGKSTFLRALAGVDRPTTGVILHNGAPVRGGSRKRALVSQDYSVFPWLTVLRNVSVGLDRTEAADAGLWLERVGLKDFANFYPGMLSGGMRQRLALARAFASRPDVLLMDEPFGALDEILRIDMRNLLGELRKETGASLVLVTHSLSEAMEIGDRVVVMSGPPGRIVRTWHRSENGGEFDVQASLNGRIEELKELFGYGTKQHQS